MRHALRILPLLLLAAFLTSGCKPESPYQFGGDQLKLPARRIISMSPGVTEALASKGGGLNWIVGRTLSCNYPKIISIVPVVVTTKPDWEKIAKQRADLIVYDPDLYTQSDIEQMAKYSRMPPFGLGGNTVDEFCKNLMKVSTMYTGETFMSEYVDDIVAAKERAQADPVKPTPTVALIMPAENGGEHMIAGKDSFYDDEIRCATGNPVGPNGTKFVPLNAESLIQMNPDIIVTAGDSSPFTNDSRFKSLSAIKNKRVLSVPEDAMLRRGARVAYVITGLHDNFAGLMR